MAKEMGHGSHTATLVLTGLVLLVVGILWLMRVLSLDQTLALLLIGWGLKKLYWASQGGSYCC